MPRDGIFGQLGQQWTSQLQALHESTTQAVAQAVQASTTRVCVVCSQRLLRAVAFECSECKAATCKGCLETVHRFNPLGLPPIGFKSGLWLQVCRGCRPSVQARCRRENVEERLKRVTAFLAGRLEPYTYTAESKVEKSLRWGTDLMAGVKKVAGFIPIANEAVAAINAGYYIIRYGPLVFMGDDVVMALQLLVALATKLEVPGARRSRPQDFFGGMYYMMGEVSGERGRAPELETQDHVDSCGVVPAPPRELLLKLRGLVRLLYVTTYGDQTPTDAQRLLQQVLPGSELVVAEISQNREVPSYYITCTKADKKAYVILPGTSNIGDIATDFNADEERLLSGYAHKGMVQSARWLLGELSEVLVHLYTKGYEVVVVGHSLGAGVGSLFTAMLRPQISSVMCYGFGTPACVDEQLLVRMVDCVVSVVNRDDFVPRLSVQNVQALAASVLCPGQVAKTKAWLAEDWKAVKDVERIVELRRREAPASSSAEGARSTEAKVRQLVDAGVARDVAERALEAESGDLSSALLRATSEDAESPPPRPASPAAASPPASAEGRLGSLFGWLAAPTSAGSSGAPESTAAASQAREAPVRTAAQEHVPFFVPGQVVHIYQENGLGRASLASSTHEALCRITPSPDMVEDHRVRAYDEVLRQACIAQPGAPVWEAFDRRSVCACCGADFNWACVLQSEPQRMLARHHCFACGRVVCDGCSRTREAHEALGFRNAVRTCDGCCYGPGRD